jgi:hypothetical protein
MGVLRGQVQEIQVTPKTPKPAMGRACISAVGLAVFVCEGLRQIYPRADGPISRRRPGKRQA